MKSVFRRSGILLALFGLSPLALPAASYSQPLGVMRLSLQGGGSLNYISNPFLPQTVFQNEVESVDGTAITLNQTPPDQLAGTHYLEIVDGLGAGSMSDIVGQSGAELTTADDLSTLLEQGVAVRIREIPTFFGVFGENNRYGFLAAGPEVEDYDRLYFWNPQGQSITQVFFSTYPGREGWLSARNFQPIPDFKLYPETGIYCFVEGDPVDLTFVGEVTDTPMRSAVFPGVNLITVFNPLSEVENVAEDRLLTLGNCGLVADDPTRGVIPYDVNGLVRHDEVLLPDPEKPEILQSYFFYAEDETWRNSRNFGISNNRVIQSGTAILLLRYDQAATEFSWEQPNLHLALPGS